MLKDFIYKNYNIRISSEAFVSAFTGNPHKKAFIIINDPNGENIFCDYLKDCYMFYSHNQVINLAYQEACKLVDGGF